MKIDDRGVFCGYAGPALGVPEVFERGTLLAVTRIDDEGVYGCQAVGPDGCPLPSKSDMVFEEEIIPLNHSGAVRP